MAQAIRWTVGGQEREFRLTMAALERLEREAGLASFTDLVVDPKGGLSNIRLSAGLATTILWCALRGTITRAEVQAWLDDIPVAEVMLKAVEVLAASLESFAQVPPGAASPPGTGTPPVVPPSGSV